MGTDPEVQLLACHRYGPRSKGNSPRPVMIKFLQYSERHKAWNNRKSLKGGNVWVKEDYPNEIEERRKVLYPYLRGAYQGDPANPQAKISAYMKYDKLVVNNQTFNHTNIMYLPEYIITRAHSPVSMKQNDDVLVFITRESPLSNFHDSPLTIDDRNYVHAEQFISYRKALLFDSTDVAERVLTMTDPKLTKQTVRRLKRYDDSVWQDEAPAILRSALEAKFSQNNDLKEILLDTGDRVLGEASPTDTMLVITQQDGHGCKKLVRQQLAW